MSVLFKNHECGAAQNLISETVIATWPHTPPGGDRIRKQFDVTVAIPAGARQIKFNVGSPQGSLRLFSLRVYASGPGQPPPTLPGEDLVPDAQLLGLADGTHGVTLARFESDPVNTATGNYAYAATDLQLPRRGMPLAFIRTYNSLDAGSGRLGVGWRHNFEAKLTFESGGVVRFHAEDGAQYAYAPDGSGGHDTPRAGFSTLSPLADETYRLTRRDQVSYHFGNDGRLLDLADRNGNTILLGYTGGDLTSITDSVGRQLSLTYNANGLLSSISGPPNRSVTYTYDLSDRLATVTDATGGVWEYGYDTADRLTMITDPNDHVLVTNTYGSDGRVSSQTNAVNQTGTFVWDPATQTSTYTDARGEVWTDLYRANVLEARSDPVGNTTRFGYDLALNRSAVTDPRGNATIFTYDAAGNLLTRTAPSPLSYVETWTYTDLNDVETYTDGRGKTTTYDYDVVGNLITVTAPDGGITHYGRADSAATPYHLRTQASVPDGAWRFDESPGDYASAVEGHANVVAYWALDETSGSTVTDSVASYAAGVGSGTGLAQAAGIFDGGTSIGFDGEAGAGGLSMPDLGLGGAFAIEMWVYWEGANSAAQDHAALASFGTGNELRIEVATGTLQAVFPNQSKFSSNSTLSQDTWTHIAYNRASNGNEKWIINGVQDAFRGGQAAGLWTGSWRVGVRPNGNARLKGRVDAIGIYTATGNESALQRYDAGRAAGTLSASSGLTDATAVGVVSAPGAPFGGTGLRPGDGELAKPYAAIPISLADTSVVTLEYWGYQPTYADDNGMLLEYTTNSNSVTGGFRVQPNASSGAYTIVMRAPGSPESSSNSNRFQFARPSAGAWHHFAIILNRTQAGSQQIRVYVDGEPVAGTLVYDFANTGAFADSTLYLWSRAGTSNLDSTAGRLDELAVYRRALSPAEIYRHYAAPTGLLTSLTDPRDEVTTYTYDTEANLTSVTSPLGDLTSMGYDAAGRMTSLVDPRGNASGANPADFTTTFTYDAADRLETTTDPLDHVTTFAYDPVGNLLSVTDANDHVTTYTYDDANRLLTVTDALDGVTA
jgi:YD repeat-containing protein